jgi:hypothetical protein
MPGTGRAGLKAACSMIFGFAIQNNFAICLFDISIVSGSTFYRLNIALNLSAIENKGVKKDRTKLVKAAEIRFRRHCGPDRYQTRTGWRASSTSIWATCCPLFMRSTS